MRIIHAMGEGNDLARIFNFLDLELSSDGLRFFLSVKKCFDNDLGLFREFIIDYLTMQKSTLVDDMDDIYTAFVNNYLDMREIQGEDSLLEQFARYAKYFLMLHFEYIKNEDFKHWISIINSYNGNVAYPFLMELLDDFEHGRIGQTELNQMALLVVNLLRNTNLEGVELRKEFATLGYNVNKMLGVKSYESIEQIEEANTAKAS